MAIPSRYYILKREYKNRIKNYLNLDIEEKIDLMNFGLTIEGINIKVPRFHTKAEAEKSKSKRRK